MSVEFGQVSMYGGRGTKLHVWTQIVAPTLTILTRTTWNPRLNGYPVTYNHKTAFIQTDITGTLYISVLYINLDSDAIHEIKICLHTYYTR